MSRIASFRFFWKINVLIAVMLNKTMKLVHSEVNQLHSYTINPESETIKFSIPRSV